MTRRDALRNSKSVLDQATAILMDPWPDSSALSESAAKTKAQAVLHLLGIFEYPKRSRDYD